MGQLYLRDGKNEIPVLLKSMLKQQRNIRRSQSTINRMNMESYDSQWNQLTVLNGAYMK